MLRSIIRKDDPTPRDVHVDQLLTNVSIAYKNAQYIMDEIFPFLPVRKQSDLIASYDQSYWFRRNAALRAPGTRAHEGHYKVTTTDNYFCPEYAIAKVIADEVRANADSPFDPDREAVEWVTDQLQLEREANGAAAIFTTGVWTTDKVGGTDFTVWSNYGGSTPLVDVATYKDAVEALIGREPNKLVLGKQVYLQLKNHPDVIDLIKYTQRGQVTPEILASLFEFERMLIGRTILTTDKEGTAEASVTYTRIWGKNALMLYTPQAPSLMTPSAGYTIVWQKVAGALQYMERFRRAEEKADVVTGYSNFVQKVTSARAGLFMSAAVA